MIEKYEYIQSIDISSKYVVIKANMYWKNTIVSSISYIADVIITEDVLHYKTQIQPDYIKNIDIYFYNRALAIIHFPGYTVCRNTKTGMSWKIVL